MNRAQLDALLAKAVAKASDVPDRYSPTEAEKVAIGLAAVAIAIRGLWPDVPPGRKPGEEVTRLP